MVSTRWYTCSPDRRAILPQVSEGLRTVVVAFGALAAGFTWLSFHTAAIPVSSADRLVSELRLAQMGAILLAMSAGAYIGLAVAHDSTQGVGLDVALAIGFFIAAAATLVREPRQALTILALAFALHAVFDVAHRPGWVLPDGIAPGWFLVGCALFDVFIGGLCYFPILRRS